MCFCFMAAHPYWLLLLLFTRDEYFITISWLKFGKGATLMSCGFTHSCCEHHYLAPPPKKQKGGGERVIDNLILG